VYALGCSRAAWKGDSPAPMMSLHIWHGKARA